MNTALIATCLTATSTAPAFVGVTPEDFVSTLKSIAAAQSVAPEILGGRIETIADGKSSFVLRSREDLRTQIRVNELTIYTLDGERSDRDSALMAGRGAKVTHEKGLASRVAVMTRGSPQ